MSTIEQFIPSEYTRVYNFTEGLIPGIDGDADSHYSINVIIEKAVENKTVFSTHQVMTMFKQVEYFYEYSKEIPSKTFDELHTIINNSSMNDDHKEHYNWIVDCWEIMYSTN